MANYAAMYYGWKPVIKIYNVSGNINNGVAWERNPTWLEMPAINTGEEQVFHGLFGVTQDEGNYLALLAQNNYEVDWGDGETGYYTSNVKAEHWYNYNLINSQEITGAQTDPMKQVIVSIRPSGDTVLTNINLQQRHSILNAVAYNVPWLDILINATGLTSLTLGGTTVLNSFLEKCDIRNNINITNFTSMFQQCYSLQSIPQLNTAAGTSFTNMFYNCLSLQSIPQLNTAAGTSFASMFQSCYSLQSIPQLNTAAGTNFTNMFANCYSLSSGTVSGARFTLSFSQCKLSSGAIVDIFNNLGTASSQTITVSSNYGKNFLTSTDSGIAEAKGWTVN